MRDAMLACKVWQVLSIVCAESQLTAVQPDSTAANNHLNKSAGFW